MAANLNNTAQTSNLGFEAKLFFAADKLRSNIDLSKYKHGVFSLAFFKHISNAYNTIFEGLQIWLNKEFHI